MRNICRTIVTGLIVPVFFFFVSLTGFAQLSGIYTLGIDGDYTTFSEVADILHSQGVSGPVVFDVIPGTYTEQIALQSIPGTSETNTVIFQSASGNSADVTVQYADATQDKDYVMQLDSVSFVTFKKITFQSTNINNDYRRVILLTGTGDHITFTHCAFRGSYYPYSEKDYSLIKAVSVHLTSLRLVDNLFSQGNFGIYLAGSASDKIEDPEIIHNSFDSIGYSAIYILYSDAPLINRNTIKYSDRGISVYSSSGEMIIDGNRMMYMGRRSLIVSRFDPAGGESAMIRNNMISVADNVNGVVGISLNYSGYLNVYHNTVFVYGRGIYWNVALEISDCDGSSMEVVNNNLVMLYDGYTIRMVNSGDLKRCDYNNLYSPGMLFARWNDDFCEDLGTLKEVSGDNAHSVSAWPGFPDDNDLHCLSAWLDGKATSLDMVTEDIDGDPRSDDHPDIGADEYVSAPEVQTPLSGTKIIGTDYPTLQAAVEDAWLKGVSDTLRLRFPDGTYAQQCMIPPIPGISSHHPVIIESESGNTGSVILEHNAAGNEDNYVLKLLGSSFLKIRNISLKATNSQKAVVLDLKGMVDSLEITSCRLESAGIYGETDEAIITSSSLYFHRQDLHDNSFVNGAYGIIYQPYLITGAPLHPGDLQLEVSGNTFINNNRALMLRYINPVVRNNTVSTKQYGMQFENVEGRFLVYNNKIVATKGGGIKLYGCKFSADSPGMIFNNFIVSSEESILSDMDIRETDNCQIYFNSVADSSEFHYPVYLVNDNGIDLRNNIFFNRSIKNEAIGVSNTAFTSVDYNCYYTGYSILGYWDQSCADLDAIRTASGKNEHSVSLNPFFLSTLDLHTHAPWLDSAAVPLAAVTVDIDGEARDPLYPDIGADEYVSPPRPVAVNDSLEMYQAAAAIIPVLHNDSGGENDSVFISRIGETEHATAILYQKKLLYIAHPDFTGVDTLTYCIRDDFGREDSAMIFIHIKETNGFTPWSADLYQLTRYGLVQCVDFNMDGDPDILLSEYVSSGPDSPFITKLFKRQDDTFAEEQELGHFRIFTQRQLSWGDFDNDGDADLIATCSKHGDDRVTRIFKNDGGHFFDTGIEFPIVGTGSIDWGDFDNDGDLDLLIVGPEPNHSYCFLKIFRNDGPGNGSGEAWTFTEVPMDYDHLNITPVYATWDDVDQDGDLDIMFNANYQGLVVYENNNGTFSRRDGLLPYMRGTRVFCDYDNDGDRDIILQESALKIYRCDTLAGGGVQYTKITDDLAKLRYVSFDLGDYDSDGDLDILLTGTDSLDNYNPVTKIFTNLGNDRFEEAPVHLPGVIGTGKWCDFNHDGRLDILLTGPLFRGDIFNPDPQEINFSCIFLNEFPEANHPPSVNGHLMTSVHDTTVVLSWDSFTDAETPAAGLTYNIRVGTTPDGSEIVSPLADPLSGKLFRPAPGNVANRRFYLLRDVKAGVTYYWSVQAVDASFAGSPFSETDSFQVASVKIQLYDQEKNAVNYGVLTIYERDGENKVIHLNGRNTVNVFELSGKEITVRFSPDRDHYQNMIGTYLGDVAFRRDAKWVKLDKDNYLLTLHVIKLKPVTGSGIIRGVFFIQNGTLKSGAGAGNVRRAGEAPITDRYVFMKDVGGDIVKYDITGEDGSFEFDSLPDGYYAFDADYRSFSMKEDNDSILLDDDHQTLDITALAVEADSAVIITITNTTGRFHPDFDTSLRLFPNPVHDHLYLRFDGKAGEDIRVRFMRMDGRVCQQVKLGRVEAGGIYSLPVSDLPAGMYILSVEGKEINFKARVVKVER